MNYGGLRNDHFEIPAQINQSFCFLFCAVGTWSATTMGAPRKGQGGSPAPLDFASRIITVAPRVEIQMHFWKGAKFAGSVGHPMTKMLSASGGLHPLDQGLCPWTPLGALPPDPRYRLMLPTRHGVPQPLTPSAAYDPLEKNSVGAPDDDFPVSSQHLDSGRCRTVRLPSVDVDCCVPCSNAFA